MVRRTTSCEGLVTYFCDARGRLFSADRGLRHAALLSVANNVSSRTAKVGSQSTNFHGFAISPHICARFAIIIGPLQSEGAGNAGCPMHPQPRVRWGSKYAHEYSQRVTGITRHSPRNGLRLIPCSPRCSAFLPPSPDGVSTRAWAPSTVRSAVL